MSRLTILHLTFIGPKVPAASVSFGEGLNLVRGPSDTGKSFIADSIDFMMGSRDLKEIPERSGYSTVLLGLRTPDGAVTLARSVQGGSFSLFSDDIRSGPLPEADEVLSPTHAAGSESNISQFLLKASGLAGHRVRKNVRNETDSLSFRNVAHLCIVDETKVQAETPPALSGSYVSKTKEISVLKLLLQDEDDSDLVASTDAATRRRLEQAKLEVVEGMISDLRTQLDESAPIPEVREQLSRVVGTIDSAVESIEALTDQQSDLVERREELLAERVDSERRARELGTLTARFRLLMAQYESDIERLDMIAEAGSLLGYFDAGTCVFCGADVEHQHVETELDPDLSAFGSSVVAEREKTSALSLDLAGALEDLEAERRSLAQQLTDRGREIDDLDQSLRTLESELRPTRSELTELVDLRSSLEEVVGLADRLSELERLKDDIVAEAGESSAAAAVSMDLGAIREFSTEIRERLAAWGFPDAQGVAYDRAEQDLLAGDQFRSAHGKGVRAILHAAFTLALRDYCLDREIGHPGFVVLDSPLVTYRAPDDSAAEQQLDLVESSFVRGFYADLQTRSDRQTIVLENTDPVEPLQPGAVDIRFTKLEADGRYGFFPVSGVAQP